MVPTFSLKTGQILIKDQNVQKFELFGMGCVPTLRDPHSNQKHFIFVQFEVYVHLVIFIESIGVSYTSNLST